MIEVYTLFNDHGASFLLGISHFREERCIDISCGLFGIAIWY